MNVVDVLRSIMVGPGVQQRAWNDPPRLPDRPRWGAAPVPLEQSRWLAHWAVWASVDLIRRLVCAMPVDAYRKGKDGQLVEVPLPDLLVSPSPEPQIRLDGWLGQILTSAVLTGNTWGIAAGDRDGWPTQVDVIDAGRVQAWQHRGTGAWKYQVDGKEVSLWESGGTLIHWPGLHPWPGTPIGKSPIHEISETVRLGLNARKFGAEWFDAGGHPGGVLTVDVPNLSRDQAGEIKTRFLEASHGREPVVLGNISTWQPMPVKPDDSQFLDTLRVNAAEIAASFGLPPESIGASSGTSMDYANIEAAQLHLLTRSIGPWLTWTERRLSGVMPPGQTVRFNTGSMLRTTSEARFKALGEQLRSGLRTQNEARQLEDLPPVTGGERINWPPYAVGTVTDQDENEGIPREEPRTPTGRGGRQRRRPRS